MEDSKKIDAIIVNLKKETGSDAWKVAEGYHSLGAVDVGLTGVTFNLDKGLIVKAFVNEDTGEVRTYHWQSVRSKIRVTLKKP